MQACVPNLNSENLNLTKKNYLNTSNFFMPWWLCRKLQGSGLHSVPKKSSKYLLSLEVLFKLLRCSEDIRDCCCLRKMFPSFFKEDLKGLESTEWWERQSYLIHMAQKYLVDVTDWRSVSKHSCCCKQHPSQELRPPRQARTSSTHILLAKPSHMTRNI